jgi:hypothetical protein
MAYTTAYQCPDCDKYLSGSATFCPRCGARFDQYGPPLSPAAKEALEWKETQRQQQRAIDKREFRVPKLRWEVAAWLTPFFIGITSALMFTGTMPNLFTFLSMLIPVINWVVIVIALIFSSSFTETALLLFVSAFWMGIAYLLVARGD